MKHTILSLMLAFLAGLSTLSAANYSGSCGTDLIWTLNTNDSVLNIYGSGAMDDYSSSSSAPWYSYRSKIKGVNLPNELTSIGNYAFNDCSNLASITFNENLESIGSYSFYKCKALKSIYLPNSITSIGDKAFASSLATTITIEKNTPPSIGKNVFPSGTMIDNSSGLPEIVEIRTTIYVPCELVQIYQTQWKDYSSQITSIPFPYTIGILMKSQGKLLDTKNNVSVVCNEGFKLSAPTYYGYHFVRWDDGDTDNPRSVDNVTTNKIFTAEYDINYYSLSVTCDSEKGSVNPTFGEYAHASEVSISASPNQGYIFKRWSDANTDNPRTITITNNTEISAIFVEENPLKSISVNGEPIAIADSMIFYDVHDDSYIPQIEVTASSITATATVAQLDKADYGWYAIIRVAESNNSIKEYKLFIINNIIKHTARITLTGEDRTSFFISTDNDAFGSVVGSTLHQYGDERQSSFLNQTGYKLGNRPSHIGMLFTSNALQEGDIVSVLMTKESNIGEDELFFYSDEGNTPLCTIKGVYSPGLYSFELGSNAPQLRAIYLYRKDMEMNPHVAYLEVTRISSVYNYSISCDESKGSVSMTNKGNIVIAHAIPNAGYSFSQWNDGNTDNPRTITLTQDTLLVAEFTQNAISRYQVQFVDWDGTILHTDSVDYGASATAPANPTREGYMFTGWDKAFDNVTEDMVVTALYAINHYNISVNCNNIQGTIEGESGEFDYMSTLTYRAIPNEGYIFTQWGDGITDNPRTITLTQDTTFTAEFEKSDICIVASGSCGDNLTWELSCDSVLTIEGYGDMNSKPWTSYAEGIKIVSLPDGLTSIESGAFSYCRNLTFITIPNSVASIGGFAFQGCTSLPEIDNLRYADTTYLVEIVDKSSTSCTIKKGTRWIGEEAFFNCSDLVAVNMPNSVIYIGHGAFYGCRNLTTITIPNKTERIEHEAFEHCTSLTSINIPSSVTSIEARSAFRGCTNLKSINVEENNPFYSSIDGVLFNKNKSSLLLYPAGNPNATYVVSDSVISIESEAFYSCVNLTSITIGKNVASIAYSDYGGSAFQYCSELITVILNSNTYVNTASNIGNVFGSQVREYILGDSIKSVRAAAFRFCTNIEKITIGKNISSLGKSVFNGCSAIKEVHWNALNYRQQKPNADSNCFPFYSSRDSIVSFVFGDSVEYIPAYLLKDFSAISSLVIPASVTEIGEYALTNDTLVEITCLADTPPTIDSTAVVGVNKSTCILYVPYTSVNAYRNAEVWKEFVNIQAIGAEEVEEPGDAIVVTPSSTSASLIWTLISNAATYELVIRDMNGNVICTLTFNALGQLTGIAFAPNRSREAQQTQAAGFQFTVSGLNSGTTYEYALTAFDENDNIIETLTGTFTTTNNVSTDIEQMNEDALNIPQKIMRDGNVYILRGDKVFTLHGKEVK